MSHDDDSTQLKTGKLNQGWQSFLVNFVFSVALHGTLLLVFASSLKSCGDGSGGVAEGHFREVGIYFKESNSHEQEADSDQSTDTTQEAVFHPADAAQQSEVDDSPPVPLNTPTFETLVLGAGAVPSSVVLPNITGFLKPSGPFRPSQIAPSGMGKTSFFGISDKGTRFVYVLDCSASMDGYAIRTSKAELMASLQGLDVTQQFQIIFYNSKSWMMSIPGQKNSKLFWASAINRTKARQFIDSSPTDGGTNHMLALTKALRLSPDVVFFLTDAGEPSLTAGDLDRIKKLNQNQSRIHCVEFGEGSNLENGSPLKKLAHQNGGSYQYRDVKKFGKK
jgi:Ca-activated chloride channel family protein